MADHWLNCVIEGENVLFTVTAKREDTISDLKKLIQKDRELDSLRDVGPHTLKLWKPKDTNPINVEPEETLVERIGLLGQDFKNFAVKLGPSRTAFSIFGSTQPSREYIHIIVTVSRIANITPSSSYESNLSSSHVSDDLADGLPKLRELHTHLWGKNQIVRRETYSTLDLALFDCLGLPICWVDTLLVRDEYVLVYDRILKDIAEKKDWGSQRKRRTATLVTGQPGIGKTLFLFYVLARRLYERSPVAFQISRDKYALFAQDGVTLHSMAYHVVPEGTWALSDSNRSRRYIFEHPLFHVIHTSSPTSSRWKGWVKELGADKYIMDVWSLEELQTLLTLCDLDLLKGKDLFEKYGPSPRIIIQILTKKDDLYEDGVNTAAFTLASKISTLPDVDNLDFSDVSSKIFTVRPKNRMSRGKHILTIPTTFLSQTFGSAMSRQAAAQQHTFFRMLKSHPSFASAGGWLFEAYGHNRLSDPMRQPLEARNSKDTKSCIPVPGRMIAGNTALRTIGKDSLDFYWRPAEPNFDGVDAIIRNGDDVWAIQYTISRKHRDATNGLIRVREVMNHISNVKWRLVMIGSDLTDVTVTRDAQKLVGWEYPTQVYASALPLGQFNEQHELHHEIILNDARAAVPEQKNESGLTKLAAGSDDSMDESL